MSQEIALAPEFIESYPDFPAHQDAIGKFTYLRTYSRYLAGKGRREVLRETVERATRYSINLERKFRETKGLPIDREKMEAEHKKLFHNVVNLKQWLSGRTMWVGGADTGVADKYPSANFNCSFTLIEDFQDMVEAFYLLMVGVGVGFKSIEETCEKLPPVRNNFEIKHLPYNGAPKNRRSDDTLLKHVNGHTLRIRVGDSKEGWVTSEKMFFAIISEPHFEHITHIEFDYNWVRPRGERLRTFGGTASGFEPLAEMFSGFRRVILNEVEEGQEPLEEVRPNWVKLRPIHVIDMMNLTGYNVVVG